MIISASRRTDIPAFYSDWFFNRLKQGFLFVRNPMNYHQISKIKLNPDVIDCFVFWTKNPKNFITNLNFLKSYNFYFQYTITGYQKEIEPNVPILQNSINTFKSLSNIIGPSKVIWRYDPIIITKNLNVQYHTDQFENIAKHLSNYTNRCFISFVTPYKKIISNLQKIDYTSISKNQIFELSENLSQISKNYNIEIFTCSENIDLSKYNIFNGGCVDDKLIEKISGYKLKIEKDKNQRDLCNCVKSIDIGTYDSCPHNCLYCYANNNKLQVKKNFSLHNKDSELLFGKVNDLDKIYEREMKSCKIIQPTLF